MAQHKYIFINISINIITWHDINLQQNEALFEIFLKREKKISLTSWMVLNLSTHPHFSFSTQAPLRRTKSSGHLHSPGMIGGSLRHISWVCSSAGSRQVLRHFTSSFGGSHVILGSGQVQAVIGWLQNYSLVVLNYCVVLIMKTKIY